MKDTDPRNVAKLVDQIRPILAGKPPPIQGGTLADLLAIWLCGFPADLRESMLEGVLATMRELIPVNAEIMYGPGGKHPGDDLGGMQ